MSVSAVLRFVLVMFVVDLVVSDAVEVGRENLGETIARDCLIKGVVAGLVTAIFEL